MPELPDVEIFKQHLDANALHRKIQIVDVFSSGILKGVTADKIVDSLQGKSFDWSRRHGKHLFVHIESDDWLEMHFGMTGHLAFFKDQSDEPPFNRFTVTFEDGHHLCYASQRKLGRIELIRDVDDYIRNHELGPDAMSRSVDFSSFKASLNRARRSTIKAALMDQSIVAGIGNVYSDEILYQSNIHPSRKAGQLDEAMIKKIFTKMKHVLRKAIDYKADPRRFPESWITPYRRSRRKFAGCIGPIESIKVSGRTAYFCPQSQKP